MFSGRWFAYYRANADFYHIALQWLYAGVCLSNLSNFKFQFCCRVVITVLRRVHYFQTQNYDRTNSKLLIKSMDRNLGIFGLASWFRGNNLAFSAS